jgi:hypothetical protein
MGVGDADVPVAPTEGRGDAVGRIDVDGLGGLEEAKGEGGNEGRDEGRGKREEGRAIAL